MSPFETTPRRAPIAYDRVQATPGNWLRNYGRPVQGLDTAGGPSLQALLDAAGDARADAHFGARHALQEHTHAESVKVVD